MPDANENRPNYDSRSRKDTSETTTDPDPNSYRKFNILEKDLRTLFSGAPYFFLERGRLNDWYPQVIFPWDDHDPSIQNMWDRKPLPHASYTLATLHAHLPIPEGWMVKGDTPIQLSNWRKTGSPRRGIYDIGEFEAPNMLSINGREPGSIGFHHFLELPVADSVKYVGPEKPRLRPELQQHGTLPAVEAYDLMERYKNPYCECDDGTVHDRKGLLYDGPIAWRRIGLRDIHMKALVGRLETLRNARHEALYGGGTIKTILDVESSRELYHTLFTNFLHHPPNFLRSDNGDRHDLKFQIKVLAIVLATPGAWFNFSLPEWRFRAGQVLWEAPPHIDGDCLEPDSCDEPNRRPWLNSGLERRWFLIQMALAGELLLRLDAIVRIGISHKSEDLAVSQQDVQHFDELRYGKVNWDLIVVRRFFDSFVIGHGPTSPPGSSSPQSPRDKANGKHHHFSFFENLAHRASATISGDTQSGWECRLSPAHSEKQLAGLFVFAEQIGWPELDTFKSQLKAKIADGGIAQAAPKMYSEPICNALPEGEAKLGKDSMYSRSPSRRLVFLKSPSNQTDTGIGGWITRSWLSGFVIPGNVIDHVLMATMLENDPDAIDKLGPLANLYGGFSYKGRSWWSKECIVGRVLASLDNSKACMGWTSSAILPYSATTSEELQNRWLDVLVKDPPRRSKKYRIEQGHKLAAHSTPLGVGDVSMDAFTLPVDEPMHADANAVKFHTLAITPKEEQLGGKNIVVSSETSMSFEFGSNPEAPTTVSLPLTYNVRFITSHECRRPLGSTSPHSSHSSDHGKDGEHTTRQRKRCRLPGHPLHKSYPYKLIPLDSLLKDPGPQKPTGERAISGLRRDKVTVIDARGCPNRETFARAWCASVGSHAIIGRVGRTCLACCIREAHAVNTAVVIRVGDGELEHPSSVKEVHTGNE